MDQAKDPNTKDGTIRRILYTVVMKEEAGALLENKKFVKDETVTAKYSNILSAYIADASNNTNTKEDTVTQEIAHQIVLLVPVDDPINKTGLFGTEIAFFLTYVGIMEFNPDVVISMGYAGDTGLNGRLPLGTVVIAKEKAVYHRRNMLIDVFENTSKGNYDLLHPVTMITELGYTCHHVGTSNSFIKTDNIALEKNIKVVEMELCSVARACSYFNTPCIGVKIISDADEDEVSTDATMRAKQFTASLTLLRNKFYESFDKVNGYLFGKNIKSV